MTCNSHFIFVILTNMVFSDATGDNQSALESWWHRFRIKAPFCQAMVLGTWYFSKDLLDFDPGTKESLNKNCWCLLKYIKHSYALPCYLSGYSSVNHLENGFWEDTRQGIYILCFWCWYVYIDRSPIGIRFESFPNVWQRWLI